LRIGIFVVPIYTAVFVLNRLGLFTLARDWLADAVVTTFVPVESLSIVVLSFVAEFTSGFAAAGALMDAGMLTTQQTVLALLTGNVLAFPIRALRHQLPHYMGIYSPRMGAELLFFGAVFSSGEHQRSGRPVLRRYVMKRKNLRTGFTTGTAAAAAAKRCPPGHSGRPCPGNRGGRAADRRPHRHPIHGCRRCADGSAVCTVIKDAGDDPDVTHGAEIGARVRILLSPAPATAPPAVLISGGEGVGRITKPGLELPPGEPAINPGPRRMITAAVTEVLRAHGKTGAAEIEVFVPQGEEISRKTLNTRLGILGGISILGTTGIVRPMSHEAFTATIDAGLSVARACGFNRVVLTTGRRSERFAQARWPDLEQEAYVQIGDFFREGLARCAAKGFETATLAVFFGKALKMAEGLAHTHAARAELTLNALANWAGAAAADAALAGKILAANTAGRPSVIYTPITRRSLRKSAGGLLPPQPISAGRD